MTNNLSSFGFVYDYEGKEYSFAIVASSPEEAKGRVAAMADAKFEGAMHDESSLPNGSHEPCPTKTKE
jgi:hypothetical protein